MEVIKHTTSAPMSLVEHWDDSTKLHLRLPSASVLGASLMLFKVRRGAALLLLSGSLPLP